MYVTQNFVAFSGWPDTRVLLSLVDVSSIEKSNTLMYVPNALIFKTADEEYFLASFLDRDQCYNFITSLCEVAKRLVDLQGPSPLVTDRNLVFGFQSNFTSLSGNFTSLSGNSTAGVIMNALSNASASLYETTDNMVKTNANSFVPSTDSTKIVSSMSASIDTGLLQSDLPRKLLLPHRKLEEQSKSLFSMITSPKQSPSISTDCEVETKLSDQRVPAARSFKSLGMGNMFVKRRIITLGSHTFESAPDKLWERFWLKSDGYS